MSSSSSSPQQPLPSDKRAIRRQMMDRRQALSAGEVEQRSRRIFSIFKEALPRLLTESYASVGLYFPIRGEVDTRPFMSYFRAAGKRCLFPRTDHSRPSTPLEYFEVSDWAELRLAKHGIGEPQPRDGGSAVRPDVVLVPGTAFSRDAHRLGFGAGHYDATIETWQAARARDSMRLLGLAYDFQMVPSLPVEPHDHALDFVISEGQVYARSGQ